MAARVNFLPSGWGPRGEDEKKRRKEHPASSLLIPAQKPSPQSGQKLRDWVCPQRSYRRDSTFPGGLRARFPRPENADACGRFVSFPKFRSVPEINLSRVRTAVLAFIHLFIHILIPQDCVTSPVSSGRGDEAVTLWRDVRQALGK